MKVIITLVTEDDSRFRSLPRTQRTSDSARDICEISEAFAADPTEVGLLDALEERLTGEPKHDEVLEIFVRLLLPGARREYTDLPDVPDEPLPESCRTALDAAIQARKTRTRS